DKGFRHLRHADGALHARGHAQFLQRILQSQSVNDSGQHSHVIAGGAVNTALAAVQAAINIAATYNDDDLDTQLLHLLNLASDVMHRFGIDTVAALAPESFATQFQKNSAVLGLALFFHEESNLSGRDESAVKEGVSVESASRCAKA